VSRFERVALIERETGALPLTIQADLLGLSRASLSYQPVAASTEEIRLKHRHPEGTRAIYTELPFYGSQRITAQLRREEFVVNRKAVQRHMQEMGIVAIGPKPNLSKPNADHLVYR
jgi:putative transposase